MFFKKVSRSAKLLTESLFYRFQAGSNLLGQEFDAYGKSIAFKFLARGKLSTFTTWFCNPVSITRYFEFPFVFNHIDGTNYYKFLDVSSPRLFLCYLLDHYSQIQIEAINPDIKDLNETEKMMKILGLSERIHFSPNDATKLPYPDNSFDVITSISVIEHIPNNGDSLAIQEMWRVLKKGGKLIITVPCAKKHYDEWRETDVYNLGNPQNQDKYFFQRLYDLESLQSRFFNVIQTQPTTIQIFGEKKSGTFAEYEKRWLKYGMEETIKDPLHIVKDYQFYDTLEKLLGVGVCGLVFEKKS